MAACLQKKRTERRAHVGEIFENIDIIDVSRWELFIWRCMNEWMNCKKDGISCYVKEKEKLKN